MTRLMVLSILLLSCQTQKVAMISKVLPTTIVYKTKKNWNDLVPIQLSADKLTVISYPSPGDIMVNGELREPSVLRDGFLLDNYGIGPNSVFIRIKYREYSRLKQAPSLDSLYSLVIDKEPFVEMWDAGQRGNYNSTEELNSLVAGGFKNCKPIIAR